MLWHNVKKFSYYWLEKAVLRYEYGSKQCIRLKLSISEFIGISGQK
jgi:hypothetical protein